MTSPVPVLLSANNPPGDLDLAESTNPTAEIELDVAPTADPVINSEAVVRRGLGSGRFWREELS